VTVDSPRVWPWAADRSPVTTPTGIRTAVAALAITDPDAFQQTLLEQLGPMTVATLGTLGLRSPEVTGTIPPYSFKGHPHAVCYLDALLAEVHRDGTDLLEVDGYGLDAARDALTDQQVGPRAFLMVMSIGAHAAVRAGRLS